MVRGTGTPSRRVPCPCRKACSYRILTPRLEQNIYLRGGFLASHLPHLPPYHDARLSCLATIQRLRLVMSHSADSSAPTSFGTVLSTPPTEPEDGFDDVSGLKSIAALTLDPLDDFSDEAVLRSYSRREAWFAEMPTKKGAAELPTRHGISAQVTRSEEGTYNGQKAHLIDLKLERRSEPHRPFRYFAVELTIRDLASSLGVDRHAPRDSTSAPFILDYVLTSKRGWYDLVSDDASRRSYKDEKFRLATRLSNAAPYGIEQSDDVMNRLSIQVFANPAYNQDLPELNIGLIVLSFGRQFTLSAQAELAPMGSNLHRVQLLSMLRPAKFCHGGAEFPPAGADKTGTDFADVKLQELWARIPRQSDAATQALHTASDSAIQRGPDDGDFVDGPDFSHLVWSEEAIQMSLEPREILAKPVTMSPEDQAAWDEEFAGDVWSAGEALLVEPVEDSGYNSVSGSATPTPQGTKASKAEKQTQASLREFEYPGKLSDYPTGAGHPQAVLDKQWWNGLRIVCLINRIQSGTYEGNSATFVGLVVKYQNSDDAHSVRRSVIRVRIWNVPRRLATGASGSASTPALTNQLSTEGHLSPVSSSTGSRAGTVPPSPVTSTTDTVPPGGYPVSPTASVTTLPSTPTSSSTALVGAPLTTSASAPAALPAYGGHVPYFVDHRPRCIAGPALEDLVTVQNSYGGQIGAAASQGLSASINAARQVTHQRTVQQRSQIDVQIMPHRRRPFAPRLIAELAQVPNMLNARARTNPLHLDGFKEIKLGTVIASNSRPFVMTVEVECDCKNALHFHEWPYTNETPAQLGPGQVKYPKNEQIIGTDDFSGAQMQVEWNVLVPPPAGFETMDPEGTH